MTLITSRMYGIFINSLPWLDSVGYYHQTPTGSCHLGTWGVHACGNVGVVVLLAHPESALQPGPGCLGTVVGHHLYRRGSFCSKKICINNL